MQDTGVDLKIRADGCIQVGSLDAQKQAGKGILGSGLLLCERAAAVRWELSDREKAIIQQASTVRRAAASTNSTRNARPFAVSVIDKKVDIYMAPPYNMGAINAFQRALQDAQEAYGIEWSEIK